MKIKTAISYALILSVSLLFSCSKDDAKPKLQLKLGDEVIELKNANFYLTGSGNCCNDHDYRDYMISDGTLEPGEDGWSLDDYTGATYYIAVELAVPGESGFEPGEFPQYYNWSDPDAAETNISYLYFETGSENEYVLCYSPNDDDFIDHSPVTVTGGFDDGDTMTMKFSGGLVIYYYNGTNWVYEEVETKLYFKGEVDDIRLL